MASGFTTSPERLRGLIGARLARGDVSLVWVGSEAAIQDVVAELPEVEGELVLGPLGVVPADSEGKQLLQDPIMWLAMAFAPRVERSEPLLEQLRKYALLPAGGASFLLVEPGSPEWMPREAKHYVDWLMGWENVFTWASE